MRILQATSEFFPYSKTGGLADMVAGLSGALAKRHPVTVATPLYRGIREQVQNLEPAGPAFQLPLVEGTVTGRWWKHIAQPNLEVRFLEQEDFFDRPGLYMENGEGYWDNPERFAFFSKAVAALEQEFDVLHLHDWQTGVVPLLLHHTRGDGGTRTVFTIHNLAYQGACGADKFGLLNLPSELFHHRGPEHFGAFNFMKTAVCYADAITTVSPQYAKEIVTPEFGEGLDGELVKRSDQLTGILNGVDYREWRTTGNPYLAADYDHSDLSGKYECKQDLQQYFGLDLSDMPLLAVVSRLAGQKGIDALVETLAELLPAKQFQFVLLGTGDTHLEEMLLQLAANFPGQVGVEIGYSQPLSHKIEAGSDFFLMPSRFEPCGLNQLYSLRYGSIPLVHSVGGLADSVIDISDPAGNGITWHSDSANSFPGAIGRALNLYKNQDAFTEVRIKGMLADHSWQQSAATYLEIYTQPAI